MRGERDGGAETAEARIQKKGTTAFFGEANALWPGHATPKGISLFVEPVENTIFSER
jgi:hypothetical protein